MAKEARRRQLLETALEIIRSEGTEALTLSYLAERAGVTKPIAYEHFGTRSGLLIALYRDYDERQTQAMRAALEAKGKTLEDVAGIVSAAYVDCVLTAGPEFGALAAALSATEEMEDFRQSLRDSYIAEFRKAFAPFARLPRGEGQALLTGLLGAAESLSQAAASGRLSRAQAVSALSHIMLGALESSAG
jgi:AcrR family transcriptional regulator